MRDYQLHLVARGLKASSICPIMSALRFFYGTTLGNREAAAEIPLPRKADPLPASLSQDEVKRLLTAVPDRQMRTLLTTVYAAGLRARPVGLQLVPATATPECVRAAQAGSGARAELLRALLPRCLHCGAQAPWPTLQGPRLRVLRRRGKALTRSPPYGNLWARIGPAVLHTWARTSTITRTCTARAGRRALARRRRGSPAVRLSWVRFFTSFPSLVSRGLEAHVWDEVRSCRSRRAVRACFLRAHLRPAARGGWSTPGPFACPSRCWPTRRYTMVRIANRRRWRARRRPGSFLE